MGMTPSTAPMFLIRNEAVQTELGLNPDQATKVNDLVTEYHEEWRQQMQAADGELRGDRDGANEDRQHRSVESRSRRAEIAKTVNAKFRAKLAQILEAAQQTRLHEIAIQVSGVAAFHDADVVKELGLTKAQQDQLAAVHQECADKISDLWHQEANGERSERFARMREIRQEELAKSTEVLTKEQQDKFATMKGKPLDVTGLRHTHGRHGNHRDHAKSRDSA